MYNNKRKQLNISDFNDNSFYGTSTPVKTNKKIKKLTLSDNKGIMSDEEIDIDIDQVVSDSLNKVMADSKPGSSKSGNPTINNITNGGSERDFIANIVSEVMKNLIPVLTATVKTTVKSALQSELGKQNDRQEAQNNLISYKLDELDQNNRRESVRINGVIESEREDLYKVISDLFKNMDTDIKKDIKPEDISECYRIGKSLTHGNRNGSRSRPILCRFVSQNLKRKVMQSKKNFRGNERTKNIFVNDDLTPLRAKMLNFIKQSKRFRAVYTRDGRIFIRDGERVKIVNNPDDLFLLGFNGDDIEAAGISGGSVLRRPHAVLGE